MPKKGAATTQQIPEVGEVSFRRNVRAKRLTISVRPTEGVRVTIPGFLPFKTALDFVTSKSSWIKEKLSEISILQKERLIPANYRTREHSLRVAPANSSQLTVELIGNEIRVNYPNNIDEGNTQVQEAIRKGIELAYRKEAVSMLPKRVRELADIHSFKYNKLTIKNIKSRWGSCSSNNNINLSIYLMKLPDELVDYVIIHELTHTIHKNHGVGFWSHLNRLTGNAKGLAARVKKYRTGI